MYGARGLELLESGLTPRDSLDELLAADPSPAQRQVAVLGADGEVAAWTGGYCLSACGHVTGKNGGHALNHELATAVRRAFAAERRPRPSRARLHPADTMVPGGSLSPRPGIAAL